jgi:hypothetical protein
VTAMSISDIKVGKRHRRDMGDIGRRTLFGALRAPAGRRLDRLGQRDSTPRFLADERGRGMSNIERRNPPRKRPEARPTYLVRLRPEPNVDPVRALRAALKHLLRRHGLRCISARELFR